VLIQTLMERNFAFTDQDGSPIKVWRLKFRTEPPMFAVGDLVTAPKMGGRVGTVVAANQNNLVSVRFGMLLSEMLGNIMSKARKRANPRSRDGLLKLPPKVMYRFRRRRTESMLQISTP